MAFNGSGTFNQATSPVVSGTVISSTNYNSQNTDFANGLTNVICKDGQTQPTANLPMATFRHTGVGNAAARTDYAAAGQVQDGAFIWCGTAGGTANALTLTPSPAIAAYAAGQVFRFTAGASPNSGATTVAVSGLTAQAVQRAGAALVGGEIVAGREYSILYNGTNFQLQTWAAANSAGDTFTGNVTAPTFVPNGSTAPTNGIYLPTTNAVGFSANSTLRAQVFDESGNTRFLIGSTTPGRASGIVAGTFMVVNPSGNAPINLQGIGASSQAILRLITNQGTETAPTATTTANGARIELSGYDGTVSGAGATINFVNGSTWSGSNRESYISLATVASGSTTATERVRVAANGSVQFPGITTTASAANAFLDSGSGPANNLLRSTSSIRYKRNVEDADPALTSKIFDLRPVWYRSKSEADNPNWGWWGFIAEEVAEVDPRLVHWAYAPEDRNEDGTVKDGAERVPDGVQYERMVVLMLAELKALRARVAALEAGQ